MTLLLTIVPMGIGLLLLGYGLLMTAPQRRKS